MTRRASAVAALVLAVGLIALAPTARAQVVAPSLPGTTLPAPTSAPAFDGDAMWIWLMSRTEGGSAARIAKRAKRSGLELVILKAADARRQWTQLNPALVAALHRRGLRVCGYQFVYGAYRWPRHASERESPTRAPTAW